MLLFPLNDTLVHCRLPLHVSSGCPGTFASSILKYPKVKRFSNIFLTQEHTTVTPANVPSWTASRSRVQRAKFVGMQHEKWRAKEGERGLVRGVKDCSLAFPYHTPLLCFTLSVFPTAPQLTSKSLRLPSFCQIISHPIFF